MKTNQFALSHNRKETSNNTATSNDMSSSSSSGSSFASTFHPFPVYSVDTTFKLAIELLSNCNTMIALNNASLNDIEKRYEDSTANTNKKIDILQTQLKDLEDRLGDIDQQQKKASTDLIKLELEEEQVKVSATTKDAFDKIRLKSLTGRVSSIEQLCVIRSNYNKRRRVSQE